MPGTKRGAGAEMIADQPTLDCSGGSSTFQSRLFGGMERLGLAQQVWRIRAGRLRSRCRITRPSSTYRTGPAWLRKDNPMQRTGTILVIDYEPTIVDLLIEILTDAGYVAYSVPPGAPALTAIARHPPALLLLDVQRPDKDGAALIARVREVGSATMPIVMMTTAPRAIDPLIVPESIELLVKPFDLDDLLACVARHVQPAQAVDQRLAPCTA